MSALPSRRAAIASPCRSICELDDASGLCIGCGRTLDEIARWASMSDSERSDIMATLPARLSREVDGGER